MLTNTVKMYECSISEEPHKTEQYQQQWQRRTWRFGWPGRYVRRCRTAGPPRSPSAAAPTARWHPPSPDPRLHRHTSWYIRGVGKRVNTAHISAFSSAPVGAESGLIFRHYSRCRHMPKTVQKIHTRAARSVPGAGAGLPMCRPETSSRYLLSADGVGRDSAVPVEAALEGTVLEGRLCSVCMNTQSATCGKDKSRKFANRHSK